MAEQNTENKSDMKKSLGGEIIETVKTVAGALIIAVVFRTFFFEPFNIPSGSMYPTLMVGDYMFVNKMSYGYSQYSFIKGIPAFEGRIMASEPERGDVVVFRNPKQEGIDYVKRIVGLPGDRLQVIAGILHINGEPVQRRRIEDYVINPETPRPINIKQYVETLPEGKSYNILEEGDDRFLDNTGVFVVPEGHYFGMGDNRDRSQDSRSLHNVGYIPHENLIGKASVFFYSVDSTASLIKPWSWFGGIRYDRLFNGID